VFWCLPLNPNFNTHFKTCFVMSRLSGIRMFWSIIVKRTLLQFNLTELCRKCISQNYVAIISHGILSSLYLTEYP
jgi:hypothetical protein